eukprot:6007119-Karenia_brevis.AAC.1
MLLIANSLRNVSLPVSLDSARWPSVPQHQVMLIGGICEVVIAFLLITLMDGCCHTVTTGNIFSVLETPPVRV